MPRRNEAEEAFRATVGELATRAQLDVLEGGREVVQQSAPLWRRVTDGAPCGWCAMLASRGPVYGSAAKAGQGRRYHGHCGCTAEPFEGSWDEWEPTPEEQWFEEAYAAVHEPGMTGERTAALMDEWMKANPFKLAALDSIEGLTDDAVDALIMKAMDAGDYATVDRLGEMLDARAVLAREALDVPPPWRLDPANPLDDKTFAWFENADMDAQTEFLNRVPYADREQFERAQYAWSTGDVVTKRGNLPTEREIRRMWDDYLDLEVARIESVAKYGVTEKAFSEGRRIRDLLTVNETTAKAWANEETLWYWSSHGRMTYASFRAGLVGDTEAGLAGKAGRAWL